MRSGEEPRNGKIATGVLTASQDDWSRKTEGEKAMRR